MATLALFAVGSAIGGSVGGTVLGLGAATIGGAIGGAVGAYIDNTYLFPPSTPDVRGPRLDDYQLQLSSEGSPIRYCIGPENKTAGVVIWIGRHAGNDGAEAPFEERTTTRRVGGKGGGGGTQTTYSYYCDFAVAFCEGKINSIRRVWADSKVIYETGTLDDRYEGITLHTGSEDVVVDTAMTSNALPDSHIEAFEGAGNVPKYKGIAYVVFDSLELSDFGNRIPTIAALIETEEQKSVRSAIADLCERGGLTSSQYDVSRVTECLTGYTISGPVSMARAIEPIMQAYDLVVQERQGVLHFFHRGDEQTVTVPGTDLSAGRRGSDRPRPAQFSQIANFDAPSAVHVNYIDANVNYDKGSQVAQRTNYATENRELVDVPLVITPSKAATIARRKLYRAWSERLAIGVSLPPTYLRMLEADVLTITAEGETFRCFINKRERRTDFSIELSCAVQDRTAVASVVGGADLGGSKTSMNAPYTAPEMVARVLDLPALIDEHAVGLHAYYGVATAERGVLYRGASVLESVDDVSANFDVLGDPLRVQLTLGVADTTLGGGVGYQLWDEKNTVTVTLTSGSLESVTAEEVARGRNHALLGNEIIGFRSATLIGSNQYRLSGLMRGRRWTNAYIDTHGADEDFTLLNTTTLSSFEYGSGSVGITKFYRALGAGGAVEDASSVQTSLNAATRKPFPPTNFAGVRNVSNDLTLTWMRQTRSIWNHTAGVAAPLLEDQTAYEIDVLSGSGGTVVDTISVEDVTSVVYTAAQQTSVGLVPGDPVYFNAYMVDQVVGRGWPSGEFSL